MTPNIYIYTRRRRSGSGVRVCVFVVTRRSNDRNVVYFSRILCVCVRVCVCVCDFFNHENVRVQSQTCGDLRDQVKETVKKLAKATAIIAPIPTSSVSLITCDATYATTACVQLNTRNLGSLTLICITRTITSVNMTRRKEMCAAIKFFE